MLARRSQPAVIEALRATSQVGTPMDTLWQIVDFQIFGVYDDTYERSDLEE